MKNDAKITFRSHKIHQTCLFLTRVSFCHCQLNPFGAKNGVKGGGKGHPPVADESDQAVDEHIEFIAFCVRVDVSFALSTSSLLLSFIVYYSSRIIIRTACV